MKCKFCGAQIDDGLTVCPFCEQALSDAEAVEEPAEEIAEAVPEEAAEEAAEEVMEEIAEEKSVEEPAEEPEQAPVQEPEPEKKKSKFPLIAVILCALAACAAVALIIFGPKLIASLKKQNSKQEEKPRGEVSEYSEEKLLSRECYSEQTVTGSEDPCMQTVVANVGDIEFTNADLQLYYRNAYYQFMNQYGSYASMFGLDSAQPLSKQVVSEGMTWEQYFLSEGLNYAHELGAVCMYCQEKGIELDQELSDYVTNLPSDLEESAKNAGMSSALEYVQESFGKCITVETFMNYFELMAYEEALYNTLDCTDDEVNAFYDANPDVMTSYGVSKQTVDVRHILIMPADADEDGTSTDEEWAEAEAEAQRIYDLYLADPTVENFIALSDEYNQDPGSQETGGLYEGVLPGEMVTEFNDWIFTEGRKEADTEIVKTDYGYHIMYFVSTQESDTWFDSCKSLCLNDKMTTLLTEITGNTKLMVYFDDIVIDEIQKAAEDTAATEPQG